MFPVDGTCAIMCELMWIKGFQISSEIYRFGIEPICNNLGHVHLIWDNCLAIGFYSHVSVIWSCNKSVGSYYHDLNHGSYPCNLESMNKWVHISGLYPHCFSQSKSIMKKRQGALLREKVSKWLKKFLILGNCLIPKEFQAHINHSTVNVKRMQGAWLGEMASKSIVLAVLYGSDGISWWSSRMYKILCPGQSKKLLSRTHKSMYLIHFF